jgi:branched-chain amino acid transport system substrate-binding protein
VVLPRHLDLGTVLLRDGRLRGEGLKYKRVAMIADDIAYGYELNAGFQRAFEDAGGKVVQKLWPPLNAPDYGTYIAQLKTNVDAIFIGFAGSNGLKFLRQYKEYGGKTPLLGGMTAIDESLLKQMGDEAIGSLSTCWYSAQLDNDRTRSSCAACSATTRSIPASMRPRPTPTARCSRPR